MTLLIIVYDVVLEKNSMLVAKIKFIYAMDYKLNKSFEKPHLPRQDHFWTRGSFTNDRLNTLINIAQYNSK